MEINLIKKETLVKKETSKFKLDETKCKTFKFNDVLFLNGVKYEPVIEEEGVQYIGFKTREEFFENINNYNFDVDGDVLINDKGYFFCPLKSSSCVCSCKKQEEVVNESADTEKNTKE